MSAVFEWADLNFRPMQEEDLSAVLAIEHQVHAFPWTMGIFHDCLRVGYSCWVLEYDGIDGFGVLSVAADEAHVLNVCVRHEAQQRGYGRRLMEHLISVAQERGSNTVFLEVRISNQVAVHLYETMGFNEIAVRPAYYPSATGREDALVFARSLDI